MLNFLYPLPSSDKDCIEDLRLYPTAESQNYIDNAVSIRAKSAELLYVTTDVEEIAFNRGYYTVDVRYFYKICGEALSHIQKPKEITGLAVFDKRVILFGSEGSAKIFSSDTNFNALSFRDLKNSNLPTAVVEAVDPIVLNMKIVEVGDFCGCECDVTDIPDCICGCFGSELVLEHACRRVYVTIGQFSIIRLERDSQLLIPAYDYCMPEKECVTSSDDDPCTLFSKISFPINEFFPPDTLECPDGYREACSTLMK
jgi:hypothetical protein